MVQVTEHRRGMDAEYTFDNFWHSFIRICEEHLVDQRAESFAFIFYDFRDYDVRRVLKNDRSIARFNKLMGNSISVFHINAFHKSVVESFNEVFFRAFQIKGQYNLPLVLFFKVVDREIEDILVKELSIVDEISAFNSLFDVFEKYLNKVKRPTRKTNNDRVKKVAPVAIKIALEVLITKIIEKLSELK